MRSVLIIVTPVVLIHAISGYVFFTKHWNTVTRLLARNIAKEIGTVIDISSNESMPFKQLQQISKNKFGMDLEKKRSYPRKASKRAVGLSLFRLALKENLKSEYKVYFGKKWLYIWVKDNNFVYQFKTPIKRLARGSAFLFLIWSIGSSAILLAIALLFMRNQLRPLYKLSKWAERSGGGAILAKSEGSQEIRKVAHAVRTMQHKLQKNISAKNKLIYEISNDLRAPIAKIKSKLHKIKKTDEIKEIEQEVERLSGTIDVYVAFSAEESENNISDIDVVSMVKDVIEKSSSKSISVSVWESPEFLIVSAKEKQLKRCLQNLIYNSIRRAKSRVSLSIMAKNRNYKIMIEDDGEPVDTKNGRQFTEQFFVTDDIGPIDIDKMALSLSIAKNIATNNYGDLNITTSKLGGISFILSLPINKPEQPSL